MTTESPAVEMTSQPAEAPAIEVIDTFDYGNVAEPEVIAPAAQESEGSTDGAAVGEATPEPAPVDESEEVDYEGKKYKVDRALKDALMRTADYTRKTQEVAEQRRAVEAREQALAHQAKAQEEYVKEYAQVMAIDGQLNQFAQVNWQELSDTDPVQAQKLWIQYSQLRDAKGGLEASLQQKQQQRTQAEQQRAFDEQQKTAKQIEDSRRALASEIKNWSPELAAKLRDFARGDGWSESELNNITVAQVKSLNRAYSADQLIKSQPAPKPPSVPAKPVPQVGSGGAPVSKRLEDMPMAEYMRARRAQRR